MRWIGLMFSGLGRRGIWRSGWSGVYRTIALTDPSRRAAVMAELHRGPDLTATLSASPPQVDLPEMPAPEQRLLRVNMNLVPLGGPQTALARTGDLRRPFLAPGGHRDAACRMANG